MENHFHHQNKPTPAVKPGSGGFVVHWDRVHADYQSGTKTLRQIAQEHGITHGAVNKRAKRDGWQRGRPPGSRVPVRLAPADGHGAGFVYVIYVEDSARQRFYKIGMSAVFTSRFSNHQCASPFDVCVACAYYVGDMRAEERFLHGLFDGKWVRGEWFRLDEADLELIARRAKLV